MATAGLGAAAGLVAQAYELYEFVSRLTWPEPATIRELYNGLNQVEIAIVRLSRDLENISYEARRAEAIEITRAVDAQRASYIAALQYSMDHPGDSAAELPALAASIALSSPSYYTFPGRTAGSPDRFDPRATLPSFINAITTWLAIRKINSSQWTETSRETLLALAKSLESHTDRVESSVDCIERFSSYDRAIDPPREPPRFLELEPAEPPLEQPPVTEPRCSHTIVCMDAMTESGDVLLTENTPGYCGFEPGTTTSFDERSKRTYLDTYYMPGRLRELAQQWRTQAAAP